MKINKKLILFLVLVLALGVVTGCKKKAPQGVGQEFYDDMITASEDLSKTIRNTKDITKSKGFDIISNYNSKLDDLTLTEQVIVETLDEIYYSLTLHYNGISKKEEIEELVDVFADLMEININTKDILLK